MQREKSKWRPHEDESTDMEHRGGVIRSSEEGAVMALERRDGIVQSGRMGQPSVGMSSCCETKSFSITKRQVFDAYKKVKANRGSAGIDRQSLEDFNADLSRNLYKLWNRMASGSYFPPPVLRVEIPKSGGGTRALGIPTVADRIAQMVVKDAIEPELEKCFHPDSYGYRPGRSAHQAVATTRNRCWKRPWVLDMDIKSFFDTIDHELLMRAVRKHVREKWQCLYIERWLKASVMHSDGRLEVRSVGTPQGGVISPLLANLFLHYAFDIWVERNWPGIQFERYADDIICHCASEKEAEALKEVLTERFQSCGLTLHPEKTKIVYCKSSYHTGEYPEVSFDFLGYTFRPRLARSRAGNMMVSFTPAISSKSAKRIRTSMRNWHLSCWQSLDISEVAKNIWLRVQGWINYYGLFGISELRRVLYHLDEHIVRWIQRKYKKLRRRSKAFRWLRRVRKDNSCLFAHWRFRIEGGWTIGAV